MGFQKQSLKCQLYFWILKSYQHGTRIGGERDLRPKHITAWTKNAAEKFCICLRLSACVHLRLCVSVCVRVCASVARKVNIQTCLDEKNLCIQTRHLFKDFRDVPYGRRDDRDFNVAIYIYGHCVKSVQMTHLKFLHQISQRPLSAISVIQCFHEQQDHCLPIKR